MKGQKLHQKKNNETVENKVDKLLREQSGDMEFTYFIEYIYYH